MIVVAIIAVLAIVVIPSFIKESRRAGYTSEVHPMFAEMSTREDQYKTEIGSYTSAAACPPTASESGTAMSGASCLANWTALRIQYPQSTLKCSYVITAGASSVNPITTMPTWAQAFYTQPAVGWFYIVATCPQNEFVQASWDSKIRSEDGH